MVRSGSVRRVDEAKQVENVFETLISKIAHSDFDLPPVLKEWKSGYYVPIKRDVYLTKRYIEDDGIFCSCSPSSGSPVACGKDCQCGTCEERLWKMRRQGDTNFYLCEVSSNMIIDATNKGNMSRFINHSCEPNTEMQKWSVDGETRVGIFALRDIKKGEELTYDYKFVQFGAGQDCHCGSSNCRTMLGTRKSVYSIARHNGNSGTSQMPARKKRKTCCENCIGQFLRLWHPREKQYVACWIYDFDNETKIHTLQFCDYSLEKFNLKKEEWHFLPVGDESD